jgi:predicted transcriptional regulator
LIGAALQVDAQQVRRAIGPHMQCSLLGEVADDLFPQYATGKAAPCCSATTIFASKISLTRRGTRHALALHCVREVFAMATAKQVARDALNELPDECSLEDISYHLYLRARVEDGMADLEGGRVVAHEQVMREATEWLRRQR